MSPSAVGAPVVDVVRPAAPVTVESSEPKSPPIEPMPSQIGRDYSAICDSRSLTNVSRRAVIGVNRIPSAIHDWSEQASTRREKR